MADDPDAADETGGLVVSGLFLSLDAPSRVTSRCWLRLRAGREKRSLKKYLVALPYCQRRVGPKNPGIVAKIGSTLGLFAISASGEMRFLDRRHWKVCWDDYCGGHGASEEVFWLDRECPKVPSLVLRLIWL